MDLDAPVEVTIGPYETYEDDLFGYKAAFEAFVTVNLPKESAALARYKERLPWLEQQPADPGRGQEPEPRHREPDPRRRHRLQRGRHPGRRADGRLQPAERRAGARGQGLEEGAAAQHHARQVRPDPDPDRPAGARPGAGEATSPSTPTSTRSSTTSSRTASGPGTITVNGRKTEVRLELKELFSTLEEAKADVMGVYNILALIEQGDMPAALRHSLEPTYVAGLFRSARFGVDEAHGQGVVAQFNYLMREGRAGDRRQRALPRRLREVPGGHPRPAARHADPAGAGRLRRHQAVPRHLRQAHPGDARRDRPPERRAGGHQAGVRR